MKKNRRERERKDLNERSGEILDTCKCGPNKIC